MCSALVGNIGTNAVSKYFAVLQIKLGLLAGEKRRNKKFSVFVVAS